jgi:hypothetical protein
VVEPTSSDDLTKLKQSWSEHLESKGEFMLSQEKQHEDSQGSSEMLA